MSPELMLTLVLAVAVGAVMGLLGGGGAILTVPILTSLTGLSPREAIQVSLFLVGATALVSVGLHARHGRVRWREGAVMAPASMLVAVVGGLAAGQVPEPVLMLVFAVVMLASGAAMVRGALRRSTRTARSGAASARCAGSLGSTTSLWPPEHRGLTPGRLASALTVGLGIGVLSGLVGAGGGFLLVPVLALMLGMPMRQAAATSLLVMVLQSAAGLAGHLLGPMLFGSVLQELAEADGGGGVGAAGMTMMPWGVALAVTGAAVLGSFGGVRLAGRIPETGLRLGFGTLVVVMGVVVVDQTLLA